MDDFEQSLSKLTLAPYIVKAMALIGVKRRSGSNMFRHQLSTMAILLDYKIFEAVLSRPLSFTTFEGCSHHARGHRT